ncbi:hypothetical protein OHD41_27405 [Escherichia coli]|nr:hypothetical protein [Escherichia coli]
MKLAPNVKRLPKDKYTDAIILRVLMLIHSQSMYIIAAKSRRSSPPPVYLGRYQLSELDNLQIVDDGRYRATVIRAGNIEEPQLLTIATKLAIAGVQEARLLSENFELLEEWSDQLPRLRRHGTGESLSCKKSP